MKPQPTKFQGGHPKLGGRRKGTPNVATAESKTFATRLVTDKTYQANLKKRLLAGKLHPGVEQMLWHYAHGKPKDHLELDDKRETSEVERIRKLDPADLRRELAEAHAEIGKALGKVS
jgi:hypothetical protein